jgi:hypothetical protein
MENCVGFFLIESYMFSSMAILVLLSVLLTTLFLYIDSRLFDRPKSKLEYFKMSALVAGVVALVVYLLGSPQIILPSLSMSLPAVASAIQSPNDVVLAEEMMTGTPNF